MKEDLKTRLRRYRDSGKSPEPAKPGHSKTGVSCLGKAAWAGWSEAGLCTLKRKITVGLDFPAPDVFPKALAMLIPDLARLGKIPLPKELLFFDLETTGLSGGAGTLAFLAAFGRFPAQEDKTQAGHFPARFELNQYLLLDFPGEGDFVEKVVKEFGFFSPPVVVSYNGKCFDSLILKNRCLMNGIAVPEYHHADLLHPTRRLWKRKLPDCSQATVELSVLGLDRAGDVPGAFAPEAWFSFLRSGDPGGLLSVCDHNLKDVKGLACLFLALAEIARDPFKGREKFKADEEALALSYWITLKKYDRLFADDKECLNTAKQLLQIAAENGHAKAAFTLFTSLAIEAEWRLKDPALALHYTECALALSEIPCGLINELERRRRRLEKKQEMTNAAPARKYY